MTIITCTVCGHVFDGEKKRQACPYCAQTFEPGKPRPAFRPAEHKPKMIAQTFEPAEPADPPVRAPKPPPYPEPSPALEGEHLEGDQVEPAAALEGDQVEPPKPKPKKKPKSKKRRK